MQFTLATIAAVASLITSSAAHMMMADPPQWSVPGEPQGPLDFSGSDFPCQNGYANPTASRTYTAGGTAQLQVQGTAVHGGGSGQMLITYDFPPTSHSTWRVMHTWEGDHPFKAAGNLSPPDPLLLHTPVPFNVPPGIPSGKAVVAWSWYNRIGNREMYMKCATVNIVGATSSASDPNKHPAMLALPTLFRANSGNGCTVPEGVDAIAFKNPGNSVTRSGGYTGTTIYCDDSLPGSGTPVKPTPGGPGGDDTEHGGDDDDELPKPAPIPTKPTPTPPGRPRPSPTPTGKPTPAKPAPTPEQPSGSCPEGKIYCNPDNTWSMCGSGYIQKMGQVPRGMKCVNGEFSAAKKRSVRFSPEHMRHRH